MRAFNAHDFEKRYSYFHDDVKLHIPDPKTGMLHGKEGIRGHFMPLFDVCDEYVVPMIIMNDAHKVLLIMAPYIVYNEDMECVFEYQVQKGDIIKIWVWGYFVVEEKRFRALFVICFRRSCWGREMLRSLLGRVRVGLRLI